jgi:fructose-bisphosphate aldolase class I
MHSKIRPGAPLPWSLTFSFGRAIQEPALEIWGGEDSHRGAAQQALLHRAHCNRVALQGDYSAAMERA